MLRHARFLGSSYTTPFYVFYLDEDYTLAAVGTPSGDHLRILGRQPHVDDTAFLHLTRWLSEYSRYADLPSRLRCTTQAQQMHQSCRHALEQLRGVLPTP
ncbi:MAG: hypothetical protein EOO40_11335 [Deltaproteobacteria bacterium]|nr:MAG: hypothetical protein EOO40_11335 [Deltaproteobacteria bacterium]